MPDRGSETTLPVPPRAPTIAQLAKSLGLTVEQLRERGRRHREAMRPR